MEAVTRHSPSCRQVLPARRQVRLSRPCPRTESRPSAEAFRPRLLLAETRRIACRRTRRPKTSFDKPRRTCSICRPPDRPLEGRPSRSPLSSRRTARGLPSSENSPGATRARSRAGRRIQRLRPASVLRRPLGRRATAGRQSWTRSRTAHRKKPISSLLRPGTRLPTLRHEREARWPLYSALRITLRLRLKSPRVVRPSLAVLFLASRLTFISVVADEPIASSPPFLPPINLGPVPQAPPSGAHYLATTLPDVAKVYQDRAEALRKRGQQVASALGSPLTSPVSPSLRRGSHPPPSVEAAQDKIWVISGQPPVAVKTPPTPEHGSVASSSKLPAVPSARKNARSPKANIGPTGRKHSLDAQTLSTSNSIKRSSPLSPHINSSANPLRSSALGSARGSPSGVPSSAKSRGSLDTTPQPSREHSPAPSLDSSHSRYEVLKSSTETASSSSAPATFKSGQTVGLGLGQIGGSSSAISTASSTTRDDIGLEAYGTKRKNPAPGWGSRLLQSMGRKS